MEGKGVLALGLLMLVCLTSVDAQVFSMASQQTFTGNGKMEPVPFNKVITNPFGTYDAVNHRFVAVLGGYYYFTFSAGMEAGKGAQLIMEKDHVQGAETLNEDTTSTGVGFTSRGIMINVQQGQAVHMATRLDADKTLQGDTYSFQTSWSGFRYNDLTDVVIAFSVANTINLIGSAIPIKFDTEMLNVGWMPVNNPYNMSSGIFRAQSFGIYFFHVSAGALPEREVRINVTRNYPSNEMASLYRTSRIHSGMDTISRSFMIELEVADEIQVINDFGSELYSDAGMQVSFSGFLYFLTANPGPLNVCFYAYKSISWESPQPASPFTFDVEVLQNGQSFNVSTGVFLNLVPGSYMFSLSAGAQPFKPVGLSLRKNSEVQMRLEMRSTVHNGIDTFSRDVILNLAEDDYVHVEADGGTATYSDVGAQTSFMGFRLRNVEP